jgi:phospholipase D3/4
MQIAESIPTNVTFRNSTLQPSTFIIWKRLLRSANRSIDIAALYWSLRDPQRRPTSTQAPFSARITHRFQGAEIFDELVAAAQRGVKVRHLPSSSLNCLQIRIAQNVASRDFPQTDSAFLRDRGTANQGIPDPFCHRLCGGSQCEYKCPAWIWCFAHQILDHRYTIPIYRKCEHGLEIVDGGLSISSHPQSGLQVKELGVALWDCGCVASDLNKVFNVYWRLGEPDARLPRKWPVQWRSAFNARRPLSVVLNGVPSRLFISVLNCSKSLLISRVLRPR